MVENILKNMPLSSHTTLGVGGVAEHYIQVTDYDTLRAAILWAQTAMLPITILGAGSNVLVSDEGVKGLVIRPYFTHISYREENNEVFVTAGAGVVLDVLVEECVRKALWGLENLSAIPGTVGAVPVQNVGAYGVEAKDIVYSVTVLDMQTNTVLYFTNAECAFGYRDSIFKHTGNRYVILEVTFQLLKNEKRILQYKDLQNYFASSPLPSVPMIRTAVIEIRNKKFPDWKKIGTAGSFFKNPSITKEKFEVLQTQYAELPGHCNSDGTIKVSLGWILDRLCSLRGYTEGNVGLYSEQALVLVCTKNATSDEILKFSEKIMQIVFEKTGIVVEREVTLLT